MISQRAQTAYKRGQDWEERGNSPKAINAYREAMAIEPDWVKPYRRVGTIYLKQGHYDEAAAAYRQAEPLTPSGDGSLENLLRVAERLQEGTLDPQAYVNYVRARDLPEEELDERMSLCQEALGLNPTFAAPYTILGKVLLAKGHLNQARVVLERGLVCDPTPFIRANLLFILGNVYLVSGLRDEALSRFRQVVELNANPSVTQFAEKQLKAAAAGRI